MSLADGRKGRGGKSPAGDPEQESDAGTVLLEFVWSLTLLFTFIFCFMEMCLAFYSYDLASELAREGTRYAMMHGTTCKTSGSTSCTVSSAGVNTYVTNLVKPAGSTVQLPNLGGGTVTAATTYASAGSTSYSATGSEAPGGSVKVVVTYVFPIKMPFVPTNALTMTSTSVMTILQ